MWLPCWLRSPSVQFSSVAQSCPTLCDPKNRSTPGLPVHHQLLELTQTHVHQVSDAIQPSHPRSSPSPPAPNPSHSKVMLKILETRLQQYVNRELPDVQAGFRKGKRTRDQIANIRWIIEKARKFQENICFIDYSKALTVWITTNCGKFLKRWEY